MVEKFYGKDTKKDNFSNQMEFCKKSNDELAHLIINEAIKKGVEAFCVCPGARNSPLVIELKKHAQAKQFFWYEERSAAFFALGQARRDKKPVAVITTSGTAAGELLPAAMEAYYTNVPLLLITADRPRRFRGTCAPQTAEQVNLFGVYAPFTQDIVAGETCLLDNWKGITPAHLNVCFEDPVSNSNMPSALNEASPKYVSEDFANDYLTNFLEKVKYPLVVVSTLSEDSRANVTEFLYNLNAPVYLEGVSGLRENSKLSHLRISQTDGLWESALHAGYPIDGILRIGGVPTIRLWRDLEDLQGSVKVCSISELPFSGLSWGDIVHVPMKTFMKTYNSTIILEKAFQGDKVMQGFNSESSVIVGDHSQMVKASTITSDDGLKDCINLSPSTAVSKIKYLSSHSQRWRDNDRIFNDKLEKLCEEETCSEASLVYELSKKIPTGSLIYLGNSLPIREWDLAATHQDREYTLYANRGLNGIDGQISTFLGISNTLNENWALLGDLTTLYDLAGPWIIPQLKGMRITIVVINNSGGQIFSRFFKDKAFLHSHDLEFKPFADLWGLKYERWEQIPEDVTSDVNRLIEIVPDGKASERFWDKLKLISK